MFLLDGTEADPGVDHDSIEVAVSSLDTLHRTGTPHEGLSRGRTAWLEWRWRPGGHLGTEGHCIRGQVGGEGLCKVLLDVDWSRCGPPGEGLRSGITRDGTSIIICFVLFPQITIISLLTSAKADVGAAIKAAESVVETVNIREAGTPAAGLSVGAQLDGRQD